MKTRGEKPTQRGSTLRTTIFGGLFLSLFQIFISFPIATWKRNKFNFEAPLSYSYSVLAITFVIVASVSLIVALLTPRKLRPFFAAFFLVLAAVIYIQQNFLAWNYGILDGQVLDFSRNNLRGFVDIALWGALITSVIFARKFILSQASNILIGVGAVTLIMTGANIIGYGPVNSPYAIDERTKFTFSEKENIIVFLFDAYQSDVLLELLESDAQLAEPLEGFTLYENNAAVFAKTYPTIPLFLTGKRYKKEQPLLEFFDTAYDKSLLEDMQKSGWDIGLYPNLIHYPALINAIDINPKIMDNAIGGVPSKAKVDTYLQSLDLSLFRAAPHILKPAIFNDGKFLAKREGLQKLYLSAIGEADIKQPFIYKTKNRHKAVGFRDLINEHGTLGTADPAFRFYHFMIPHAPNRLDAELNLVPHEPSFNAFRDYSIAGLKLMGTYLERLKDIGAYDNATILILSDHGMGTHNRRQYDPQIKSYEEIDPYGLQRSAAKAIFMMKPPGKRGALKLSDRPVSGIDVAPTLAAAAGMPLFNVEGQDVETIESDKARTRIFNYYTFSTWDSKYLDDFETFNIVGHVRDDASWIRKGMTKEARNIKNRDSYKIGELLSFGTDSKIDSDFLNAFIEGEDHVVSANYIKAPNGRVVLSIDLDKPVGEEEMLLLQFEIYSGQTLPRRIKVNDQSVTTTIIPKRRKLNNGLFITPDIHEGRETITLSFEPTSSETAKALNLSSVKLTRYSPPELGTVSNLVSMTEGPYLKGFHSETLLDATSHYHLGSYAFKVDPTICSNKKLRIAFDVLPDLVPRFILNAKEIQPVSNENSATGEYSFNCSAVVNDYQNLLDIFIPKQASENYQQYPRVTEVSLIP